MCDHNDYMPHCGCCLVKRALKIRPERIMFGFVGGPLDGEFRPVAHAGMYREVCYPVNDFRIRSPEDRSEEIVERVDGNRCIYERHGRAYIYAGDKFRR
jgi:hypothetical protein